MADEATYAKEIEKELMRDNQLARPSLKAVPAPQRRTKQMLDQFVKIKEGLQADLHKAQDERNRIDAEMDDLELAIRVISSAQAMLDRTETP